MNGMNSYTITYRPGVEFDRAKEFAYRVEGWSQDYAFFANPNDLREATLLVPRELVLCVSLDKESYIGPRAQGHVSEEPPAAPAA